MESRRRRPLFTGRSVALPKMVEIQGSFRGCIAMLLPMTARFVKEASFATSAGDLAAAARGP